jgi:glycosyltransferase involved in cell wall biosynthesis
MKLAIIIPMYNEEVGAENCVQQMMLEIAKLPDQLRLFAVNDGSKDGTLKILERLRSQGIDFELVDQQPNQGYGAACISGAAAAYKKGFTFGLFMDSDLTNDPRLIPLFWEKLKTNSYDFVKASRYIKGGGMHGVPLRRQIPTIVGNRLARFLFGMGINDCTNGFRAVRLSLLQNVRFEERGFPSIVEELYVLKTKGAKGTEIPYTLTKRADGDENSKFSYSAGTFWRYLKYSLRAFLIRK